MSENSSQNNLLDDIESRQDELLRELDQLNRKIEDVIKTQGSGIRGRSSLTTDH